VDVLPSEMVSLRFFAISVLQGLKIGFGH
jgi:hypothetical protein